MRGDTCRLIPSRRRIGTEHAGAGAFRAIDGPMEPGGLAPPSALRKEPQDNGRLWFNDYPYGILAAETYMVLAVLDLMGSHKAAEDGFDQWVSLPMDPNSKGHHPWALPDRPNGLFSEGHGCLTHAVGPAGGGGHMDGVHAFGPGSIGWALIEHYRLTGDTQMVQGRRTADQGQCRVDAAPAARRLQAGSRRRPSLVQGPATGPAGDPGQRRIVDAVLRVRGLLLGLRRALRGGPGNDRSRCRRQAHGRGGSLSQGLASGGGAVHRALAGGSRARRHLPFGHSLRLLRARLEHGGLGLATRWLRQPRRPAVLGHGPVGGGADQSGRAVAAGRRAGAGISRRPGRSIAA